MARSIPRSPHLSGIFSLLPPHSGAFAKEGGWTIVKKTRSIDLKVTFGSNATCANVFTVVFTCEREMTKRRTCTVRGKVAVLAAKKQFELEQILQKYIS